MNMDDRHKKLLLLLDDLSGDNVSDREIEYVEESGGRVYVRFSGNPLAKDGSRISISKTFAVEVVCDLYEGGYISEAVTGKRLPDPGFGSIPALRDIAAKRASTGKHKIPVLEITARGRELVENKFDGL